MRNLLSKLDPLKPLDLTLPVILKLLSDFHHLLKKISPLGSVVFIFLNIRHLFISWKPFFCLALLVPAMLISPSSEILRFMMSICVLWIFFNKLDQPDKEFSPLVGWFVTGYVFAMAIGILIPTFYMSMDNGTLRYKFITESFNALTIIALISQVYLVNMILALEGNRKQQALKIAAYIALLLVFIVLLFIKSRLYLGISFFMVLLIAIQKIRSNLPLAIAPVLYLIFFISLTLISPQNNPGKNEQSNEWKYADNQRVLSTDGTGRGKLFRAFWDTYRELGWKNFIYQNNVNAYLQKKAAIPGINLSGSALTESTYLVLLLYGGFLVLFSFLFIFAHYLWRFFRRREYYSLSFMLLLTGVWLFEESVFFPLNMITQFFALATINRLETKK